MTYQSLPPLALIQIVLAAGLTSLPGAAAASDINATTSYSRQNEYYCRLAKVDAIKPIPVGIDHFRLHDIHRGIADLYADGTIDMVFGASDETFSAERVEQSGWPAWVFEGNEARSRDRHQYAFYSPDMNFVLPAGTRYLNARTILTQDFNADGLDDLAMAVWGTDYEPYIPMKNEILLSSSEGYKARLLPGTENFGHGASAGDIDNDGDVDILVTGANRDFSRSRVYRYTNDGEGNFAVSFVQNLPDTDLVSLFDVDDDGNLDVFTARKADQTSTVEIYWGMGNGQFDGKPVSLFQEDWLSDAAPYTRGGKDSYTRYRHRSFSEPVFADSDGDGRINLIIPSNMDLHFSLFDLEFEGRDVAGFKEIFRTPEAPNEGTIPALHWLNACDLGGNGVDLVYEIFGQRFYGNASPGAMLDLSRADKVVFKNDGKGAFNFYKLESPIYFDPRYRSLLEAYAEFLGVSIKGFEPEQVYYPNTFSSDDRFFHPSYQERRSGAQLLPYNTVPAITERLGFKAINGGASAASTVSPGQSSSPMSDRARRLLEQRRAQSKGN